MSDKPSDPCAVNKFDSEAVAVAAAKRWSLERREEFTVIHGMGDSGLAYFVERGDGGMIRSNERVVARFDSGKRQGGDR